MTSWARRPRRLLAAVLVGGFGGLVAVGTPSPAVAEPAPLTGVSTQSRPSTASNVLTTTGQPCNPNTVGGCGAAVTMRYGTGVGQQLVGFSVEGDDYRVLDGSPATTYVDVYRVDNANVSGVRDVIFAARPSGASPFTEVVFDDPAARSTADVLRTGLLTEGTDDVFANTGSVSQDNIERISFLRRRAIVVPDPRRAGLTVLERGGNDAFTVAAITAVDDEGGPVAWGPLIPVPTAAWSPIVSGVATTVLRRNDAEINYRPIDSIPPQNLSGVYVSLADLSVPAGRPVFGVSILPNDADDPAQRDPVLTTDGAANGGLDLIGGLFATANPPTAQDEENTGAQGAPQTLTLRYTAGDTLTEIDRTRTVLLPPADGVESDGGRTVTVPGEGTYTLDPADDTVVFRPVPAFTGTATPIEYRVTDFVGATATASLGVTVTPVTPTANPDFSTGGKGSTQSVDPLANDTGNPGVELNPASLTLLDTDGRATTTVTVPEQGTYTLDGGRIMFAPSPRFTGTATPVSYRVADTNGTTATSTYLPTVSAAPPPPPPPETVRVSGSGPVGTVVELDLRSVQPDLVPGSVVLLDDAGEPVTRFVVDGEGVWTADADGTVVTFSPDDGFRSDPTPVRFRGRTNDGTAVLGTLEVRYTQSPPTTTTTGPPPPPTTTELPPPTTASPPTTTTTGPPPTPPTPTDLPPPMTTASPPASTTGPPTTTNPPAPSSRIPEPGTGPARIVPARPPAGVRTAQTAAPDVPEALASTGTGEGVVKMAVLGLTALVGGAILRRLGRRR